MFKNAEHRGQPERYKTNLLNHVNDTNPDFEKILKTDMQTRVYGQGEVKMRIFKIYFNRKKKSAQGKKDAGGLSGTKKLEREDSDSDSSSVNDGESSAKMGKGEDETIL